MSSFFSCYWAKVYSPGSQLLIPDLPLRPMPIRRIAFVAFLFAATLYVSFAQTQADDPGNSLLAFLNQSIDWYHRVQFPSQLSNDPSDSLYTNYNRTAGLQAVSLILDFGRIQAEQMQLDHSHDAPAASSTAQPATLSQRVASAQDKIKRITAGLDLSLLTSNPGESVR